jgi:hypothetical protein
VDHKITVHGKNASRVETSKARCRGDASEIDRAAMM